MKRSASLNMMALRKKWPRSKLSLRIAGAVASMSLLSGCGTQEAMVYETVQDCISDNLLEVGNCQIAYQNALNNWAVSAPKYLDENNCEEEFGDGQCYSSAGYFMPVMAGFMLGYDDDDDWDFHKSKGLGRSKSRRSSLFNQWVGAGGVGYGAAKSGRMKIDSKAFSQPISQGKVYRRGGFGRTVSSRSSFGG